MSADGDAPRRQPILNLPPIVSWTAGIITLAYIVYLLLPEAQQSHVILDYSFIPGRAELPPQYAEFTNTSFAWSLLTMVTHTLLHGSWMHLIFNMAWLAIFGTITWRISGNIGFAAVYLIGAVAGAGLFWALNPGSLGPVVGASGAVSGLMGASARALFGPIPAPLTSRPLLGFTAAWLVLNLIFAFTGFDVGGETGQIAWEAHVGGYFGGLLLGPLFLIRRRS